MEKLLSGLFVAFSLVSHDWNLAVSVIELAVYSTGKLGSESPTPSLILFGSVLILKMYASIASSSDNSSYWCGQTGSSSN